MRHRRGTAFNPIFASAQPLPLQPRARLRDRPHHGPGDDTQKCHAVDPQRQCDKPERPGGMTAESDDKQHEQHARTAEAVTEDERLADELGHSRGQPHHLVRHGLGYRRAPQALCSQWSMKSG